MEHEVSRASELLQQLSDEGLSVKRMAALTDYSYQQTWKFVSGEANPTPDFLYHLFKETGDLRIADLILGGRKYMIMLLDRKCPKALSPDFRRELIQQRQKELNCELLLLKILEDGKIDSTDRQVIEQYNKSFYDSMIHASSVHQSVMAEAEKIMGASV